MALPLAPGLTPPEVAFLCEMELVTIIPRQRLEGLDLLGGPTPTLIPQQRANLPLWLALLLKRQRRANIIPPPWLQPNSLQTVLDIETIHAPEAFSPAPRLPSTSASNTNTHLPSPPFLPTNTISDGSTTALPYHWLELSTLLLSACSDDFEDPDLTRRLLRDLQEVRASKLRAGVEVLDGAGGVKMNGVGAMEVAEGRGFITGVVDGLRKIGASREVARREAGEGERNGGFDGDGEDEEMDI